jgi:calcium-dependent protein kinase
MFDKDGSGSISGDEIKEALGMTGDGTVDEKIQDIMKQVDDNGDGEISFEEFKFMMKKLSE